MSIRIGFPERDSADTRTLLAQHQFFGGPLAGLRRSEDRVRLLCERACAAAMLQTVEAYRYRAPRRGVAKRTPFPYAPSGWASGFATPEILLAFAGVGAAGLLVLLSVVCR